MRHPGAGPHRARGAVQGYPTSSRRRASPSTRWTSPEVRPRPSRRRPPTSRPTRTRVRSIRSRPGRRRSTRSSVSSRASTTSHDGHERHQRGRLRGDPGRRRRRSDRPAAVPAGLPAGHLGEALRGLRDASRRESDPHGPFVSTSQRGSDRRSDSGGFGTVRARRQPSWRRALPLPRTCDGTGLLEHAFRECRRLIRRLRRDVW